MGTPLLHPGNTHTHTHRAETADFPQGLFVTGLCRLYLDSIGLCRPINSHLQTQPSLPLTMDPTDTAAGMFGENVILLEYAGLTVVIKVIVCFSVI